MGDVSLRLPAVLCWHHEIRWHTVIVYRKESEGWYARACRSIETEIEAPLVVPVKNFPSPCILARRYLAKRRRRQLYFYPLCSRHVPFKCASASDPRGTSYLAVN